MLTERELEQMRTQQDKALPETVYIQRLTRVMNDTGGWSETWATVATVKGRIGPSGKEAEEREIAGRLGVTQAYTATRPAGTERDESDRLQIDGRQFEVKGVIRRSQATALRVVCVEV